MIISRLSKTLSFLTVLLLMFFSFLLLNNSPLISAEPNCDNPGPGDLDYCIEKIQQEIDALKPAHEYNKQELANLRKELSSLSKQISGISAQLVKVEGDIDQREEDLAFTQEIFEAKVDSYYRFLRSGNPLLPFLSSSDATEAFRERNFLQKAADENRKTIISYAEDLIKLKEDKDKLESNRANLAAAKKKVDEQEKFLSGEVAKVESYITTLSTKQQQFIAQKLGSLNLPKTLGAGALYCTDDRNLNPGFSPAFAFYTYGIPHRVGMNQYGAYGRSKAGQAAEQILKEYFNNVEVIGGFDGKTITVNGTNEFGQTFSNEAMNVEDYLKHLHEMPTSWPIEALKAQAIAARSYALAEQTAKGFVYPSQKDQVIKKELNNATWQSAVDATRGKAVLQGGQPIKAWYASTSGGYTFTSAEVWGGSTGWTKNLRDTSSGVGSFGDLNSSSYDKESPCFYAAQGWRSQYGNSAWLKPEEVADIVNTLLLVKRDPSTAEHLYQVDNPPPGTENWDANRVKQELQSRGGSSINSVSNISVSADFSSGRATTVNIDGQSFSADEFKNRFNLRAPANIQIVGPLFNIEKK